MPRYFFALVLTLILTVAVSGESISIIPQPQLLTPGEGHFTVTAQTPILIDPDAAKDAADCLVTHLAALKLISKTTDSSTAVKGAILLTSSQADATLGDEGYVLDVTPDSVVVRAPKAAGLFYGVQTTLQLLPPAVYSTAPGEWTHLTIPTVHIQDRPRFRWRGLMFDVSRHFEPKEMILNYLDQMAMHKLNVFHWHLTDDQGWRIEIKKYPRLTEIGAWRNDPGFGLDPRLSSTYNKAGQYGGFYTQDDIRQVVDFAAHRHIMIVPEIEMPGHATAALAAYPEFGSSPGPLKIEGAAGVFEGIYDPANEKTYTFLEDVLTEVMELFPSPYIHVGGDEVHKDLWTKNVSDRAMMDREHMTSPDQLQSYVMIRIGKFLSAHGRHMIGWDEILEGGLAPDATVMSWRGIKGGVAAAKADHDVVMSPSKNVYLDSEQAYGTEPHERGKLLTVQMAYAYEPIPEGLSPDEAKHVLGLQGNLWTEYVPNMPWAQYMTWPRETAFAEVGWTDSSHRNFDDFAKRLIIDQKRLDAMGVNYRPMEDDTLTTAIHLSPDAKTITIENPVVDSTIHYTIDGTYPTADSPTYSTPFAVPGGFVHVVARYFRTTGVATPAAAATFLDGHAVHVTSTVGADWDSRATFFFTPRFGMGANDAVTITFDISPVQLQKVLVQTGDPAKPGSVVQHGLLEISGDGKSFNSSIAVADDGIAEMDVSKQPVSAIRIRLTAAQKTKPVIRSVSLQ